MRMEGVITVNAISGICRAKTSWCYSRPDNGLSRLEKLQCFTGHAHFAFAVQQRSVLKAFPAIFNWQGGCRRPGRRQRIFRRQRSTVTSG